MRAGRRARSGSSPASRRSSVSSKSTAARRSTARTATSSSGSTPCGSIACARLRNAGRARAARPSGPAGRSGSPLSAAPGRDRRRRTAGRSSGSMRPAPTTSPNCVMFDRPRTSARPRRSPTARSARTSTVQAAVRAGADRNSTSGAAPDPRRFELQGRDPAGQFLHPRRPESLCRGRWARLHERARATPTPAARHLRQRHREQPALRSLQRALHKDEAGRRITDPSPARCSPVESEEGD